MSSPCSTDADAAYRALLARDARFDGRFFVGVTSTGVYCRPICRVRVPRRENCRFFDTRAQAEAAAFRPCMKCRPEIAPGLSHTDSSQTLAADAARRIEHAVQDGRRLPLSELARQLGVTDRHLRRIFVASHGVGPIDYVTTQRLLLAKQLLSDTRLPITQVALASGFASVRRFNAAFALRYRINPTQLRGERNTAPSTARAPAREPMLRLAYRPPYDIAGMLGHLERRMLPGIEQVDTGALLLRRTLVLQGRRGWIEARFEPERHEVHIRTAASLAPVLGAVLQRMRGWLDLDADPALIDPAMALLPRPGGSRPVPGARLPGSLCGFETAVRVVLGQQVTVKAARTLTQRLVQALGTPLQTPFPGLDRCFPDAETVAAASAETIGLLGIVRQRVRALQALAAAMASGQLRLDRHAPLQPTLAALLALPGIGDWTAQVVAMRALAWPDAWPAGDIGLMNALGSRLPKLITAQAEAWRPWRGYAVLQLWGHLETGAVGPFTNNPAATDPSSPARGTWP